jgi:hypothetical protein
VISNTAQRPKEKKDKIDKQWSAIQHNGQMRKGQNRQTVISTTAQWPKEKKDKIDKQWLAIQHNDQRKKKDKIDKQSSAIQHNGQRKKKTKWQTVISNTAQWPKEKRT